MFCSSWSLTVTQSWQMFQHQFLNNEMFILGFVLGTLTCSGHSTAINCALFDCLKWLHSLSFYQYLCLNDVHFATFPSCHELRKILIYKVLLLLTSLQRLYYCMWSSDISGTFNEVLIDTAEGYTIDTIRFVCRDNKDGKNKKGKRKSTPPR